MNSAHFRLTLSALLLSMLLSVSAIQCFLPATSDTSKDKGLGDEGSGDAASADIGERDATVSPNGPFAGPEAEDGQATLYPSAEQDTYRPPLIFPHGDGGSRSRADYDIGLNVADTYYVSSGIKEWGYASLGIVGRPVEIHASINNYGTQPVGDINLTCTIYLWLDIGPLNGGPIVFRQSQMVSVSGGYGSNSGDIPFIWTPAKAQCYLINISARYGLDPNYDNNEGWFYGTAYPQPLVRFITGLYTNSWANNGSEDAGFSGDLAPANAWHIVQDVPISTVEKSSENAAWYFGNDTSGNCSNVTGPVALITPPVSLADYDPYAKDPEEPASAASSPQIYFDYKWAGNIPLSSEGGLFTYISTDNGQNWEAIVTDDFGYDRAVNGTTYNDTFGKYRWKFWVHDTKNQYQRYGIPIGKYVGQTVKFKLEYRPGNGNRTGITGLYIDDLLVWGRQRYDYRGFTLETLSALDRTINATDETDFAFRVSTIEDQTQSVRVSLKDGPEGWSEATEVVISDPLFYLGPKPSFKDFTVRVKPPESTLAGRHTLNISISGDIQWTLQLNLTVLPSTGLSMTCDDTMAVNKSGDSPVFRILVANDGNLPKGLWLNLTSPPNDWAGLYTTSDAASKLDNVTLKNRETVILYLRVDIPGEVLPGDYAYRIDAEAMDGSISANLTLVVMIKQYYDLKLTIANPHQQITLSGIESQRTIEFQFLVTNQGNGQDQFSVVTTPVRQEDTSLRPVLITDNNTLAPTEVSDVRWTLIAPLNMSYGYHNYTVHLQTNNTEIDYSDNAGLISILVTLPQVVDVFNLTFEGALKANPQRPARGQSVEFTAQLRNTGNMDVQLKVWMNASGVQTPAILMDALAPNSTRNVSVTWQFMQSGAHTVSLVVEMYSNLTKPMKGRVQIEGSVNVGDIDLRVDSFSLLRSKVVMDPKKDPLHNNDTVTISMNISNIGDVNASDIVLTIFLIEGNNTTILANKGVAFLEAGSNDTQVEVFAISTDSDRIILKVQVSGPAGYLDVNMSNNMLAQEYLISTPDDNPEITLWALLIIMVSVILFLTLILVVYIVTVSREGKAEDGVRSKDGPASPSEAEDLKIDFIDYEEALSEKPSDTAAPGQKPKAMSKAASFASKPKVKPSGRYQKRSIVKKKKGPKKNK